MCENMGFSVAARWTHHLEMIRFQKFFLKQKIELTNMKGLKTLLIGQVW